MLKKTIACLGLALLSAGCGTIMDAGNIQCQAGGPGPRIYGGVRTDIALMKESDHWAGTTILMFDCIPSVVYDTILLPASITKSASK